jgi:predicted secreted protein
MNKQLAVLLLGLSTLHMAHAEDKPVYERIAFAVSAEKEVPNDMLAAVLYAEQQGQDSAALADSVNQAITWALDIAKQETVVESRTLNYTTNPVYTDGRVTGWQVRQSIQLNSKDSKVLSGLLGKLQEKLRIEGIHYSVSPEVQAETEKALIDQALKNFKERADQLKSGMGRAEYRVVRLDVQAVGGESPQPPLYRMAAMAADAAPAPPSLEGGKQNLQVNVQAEIELSIN